MFFSSLNFVSFCSLQIYSPQKRAKKISLKNEPMLLWMRNCVEALFPKKKVCAASRSWRRGIVSVVCQRTNFFWPKWRSLKISLHQWQQKLRTLFSVKMKHLHFRRTGLRNRRKKPWWWLTYCDKVSKNISCLIKCGKLVPSVLPTLHIC